MCPIKARGTPRDYRRIARREHEAVLDALQDRLDRYPEAMQLRRQTVEHPFATLKAWMGSTHFLTKRLPRVSTEISLHLISDIPQQAHVASQRGGEDRRTDRGGTPWRYALVAENPAIFG
jgi:hypothetical protein